MDSATSPGRARAQDALDEVYERIASDLGRGEPLRVRIYVALCDNDSQGIVPVKNPAICDGERPEHNIYWGTSGGLLGYLDRHGFRRVAQRRFDDGPVSIEARWSRRYLAGGALRRHGVRGAFQVELEAIAYRGRFIRRAMSDYLAEVHATARAPGAPHVIGYIGHDYLLDTADDLRPRAAATDRERPPGPATAVFALSCYGDSEIRPVITRPGAAILLLNRGLTYPGAWSVGGLLEGLSRGLPASGIRRVAADHFARGKGRPPGSMNGVFAR